MTFQLKFLAIIIFSLFVCSISFAAKPDHMKQDNSHVTNWNRFANNLHVLHKELVKNKQVRIESSVGGYADQPKFYQEKKYYDKSNGKLISIIQTEMKKPNLLHVAEIFIRDKNGKVIRDYSVTYLPYARNAPVQTLINLHGYSAGMHGFRQFDVSGDLIYENCVGTYKGKKYNIRLFEDDLINGGPEIDKIMAAGPYKACFKSVGNSAKKFIENPH